MLNYKLERLRFLVFAAFPDLLTLCLGPQSGQSASEETGLLVSFFVKSSTLKDETMQHSMRPDLLSLSRSLYSKCEGD